MLRAQSTGHRAQSAEHRAQSTGYRARAQSTGHGAQGTEHRAQGTVKERLAACGQRRVASGVENMKGRMGEKETKIRREGCIIWIPSAGEPAPLSGGFGVGFGYTISNLQLAISN